MTYKTLALEKAPEYRDRRKKKDSHFNQRSLCQLPVRLQLTFIQLDHWHFWANKLRLKIHHHGQGRANHAF